MKHRENCYVLEGPMGPLVRSTRLSGAFLWSIFAAIDEKVGVDFRALRDGESQGWVNGQGETFLVYRAVVESHNAAA